MHRKCIAVFRHCKSGTKEKVVFGGMKKYEYVTIHIGKFFGAKSEEHRKIIDEYAANGYRYVGYIPTVLDDFGKIKDIDLIFEQDI